MQRRIEMASEEDIGYIEDRIRECDLAAVPGDEGTGEEQIAYKVTDGGGNIIAGCILEIDCRKVVDIDILWVDERYRRQGIGSALIAQAERTAKEKGCHLSCIETYDFQARPLYEKHGYRMCGTIPDFPKGHEFYTLRKRLDLPYEQYVPENRTDMEYKIEPADDREAEEIFDRLVEYNFSVVPPETEGSYIPRKITDGSGNIIAGCGAEVFQCNVVKIHGLWTDSGYRHRGMASALLYTVEKKAKELGAYMAIADAFDWQVGFFERRGYTVACAVDNWPMDHYLFTLWKKL